jgi:hypothetical protein
MKRKTLFFFHCLIFYSKVRLTVVFFSVRLNVQSINLLLCSFLPLYFNYLFTWIRKLWFDLGLWCLTPLSTIFMKGPSWSLSYGSSMHSVPITTNVVSSNSTHDKEYLIQNLW